MPLEETFREKLHEERVIARARERYLFWIDNGNARQGESIGNEGVDNFSSFSWVYALIDATKGTNIPSYESKGFVRNLIEKYGREKVFERVTEISL